MKRLNPGNNHFFIAATSTLFFLFSSFCNSSFSQQKIYGVVRDKDSAALAGVSITVKNSNQTTTSANDGSFSILARHGDELIFSYSGAQKKSIIVGNATFIDVTMSFIVSSMNEVVVIGYGTAKKKDLTGSVGSVSARDFNKGIFSSPDQLIQGKVAGVQISGDNGQPGGASTIKIRGSSALSGTGQPLYVVDGVPLDGRTLASANNGIKGGSVQTGVSPLNFINPDDIATIDVLKDASATAIYGSRAAYGVVIINTKKAHTGQPKLNVSVATGLAEVLKKIKVLNASQFRDAIKYYGADTLGGQLDKGGDFDAFDAILQNAVQQTYTIGVGGGNETAKYRLSSNYLNQDGIVRNTNFKKFGVDITSNFKFLESKKLGLDININSSQYVQEVPVPEFGAITQVVPALRWNPTDTLRNENGSLKPGTRDNPNPLELNEQLKSNFKVTTILASIIPSYKFANWLEYKLLLSVNYSSGTTRSSAHQDLNPARVFWGSASITNSQLTTYQLTQTLNFNKKISGDLNLDAVAGFEYMDFTMKGSSMTGTGAEGGGFGNYGLDYTNYIQYSAPGTRTISSFIDPVTQLQSFFGRAIFDYKNRYLLTGTFRADGSTKFGENNKYGYFPSFAAAWNVSKEHFFKSHFVNLLKIRAGWGKTGNQEFPSGAAQAEYSFFDGASIRQVNNPNPNLKWQSDKQFNIGVDFSLADNRISGTIDYFNKTTTDLLFPSRPIQPAPPSSVVRWINLDGEIINKGLEVLLNTVIIRKDKITWDLNVNATFLKNNVSGISAPVYTGYAGGTTVQIIQNGLPMQTFYTRKFLGLDKASGLSVYEDNGATYYYVGNPNPNTLLGLSSTLRYSKLSITANMYGAFGQDMYNVTLMNWLNVSGIKGGANIALSVYEEPVKENLANPVTPSSRYIMNGSYFKMANLTIAYDLGNVVKVFKGTNIYITARNLFMITKYPGLDPETNSITSGPNDVPSLGLDYPHYPSQRTFIFGINFSL